MWPMVLGGAALIGGAVYLASVNRDLASTYAAEMRAERNRPKPVPTVLEERDIAALPLPVPRA